MFTLNEDDSERQSCGDNGDYSPASSLRDSSTQHDVIL
jgi:hypothetical protein